MGFAWFNLCSYGNAENAGGRDSARDFTLGGDQIHFGNPGTTELPLIDALVVNPDFRYVWGLQEATVVSMADGYAQASGKPAFVNLHTSGGLGHGMGAIMNAKIARVPMVITAGQQDLRHILADPLLAADLVQIAAPAAKWS